MKKSFKYAAAAVAGLMMTGLGACTEDYEYTAAEPQGALVYFSNELPSVVEINPEAGSFDIVISRVEASQAATVQLDTHVSEGSIFTVPTQATFDAGQQQGTITVTYNPADIEYGRYDTISVSIADKGLTTQYGNDSYVFVAGKTAWVSAGTGYYREDYVNHWFGVENLVYEVEVQRNTVTDGLYRLVNPYGKAYEYNEDGDWDTSKDYYLTVDASDPDHVFVENSPSGMDWGYGAFNMWSMAGYFINRGQDKSELIASNPEYFGTLKNGIITMPANSLLISMSDYSNGSYYQAGTGQFAIALPGWVIADYALSMTYMGRFTDTQDVDHARLAFVFGKDVESISVAVLSQADVADEEAALEQFAAGSLDAEAYELTASGTVEVPLAESGKYVALALVYAGGEVVSSEAFGFKFQASGVEPEETWTPAFTGTYTYGVQNLTTEGDLFYEGSEDVVLYVSDQDESRYKVLPWGEEGNESGLVFTLDDDGIITVEEAETGYVDEEYGMVYATDVKTYGAASYDSYYENGVFTFLLAYHDYDGPWAYQVDQLKLTGNASRAASPQPAKAKSSKHVKNVRLLLHLDPTAAALR